MTTKRFNLNKRKFHKRNFSDVIEVLLPDIYVESDNEISGTVVDPCSEIVNSHLNIASNILTILPLSGGVEFYSLSSFDGIAPFFIKQNNFNKITPESFERYILNPLGSSFKDFNTNIEFRSYITDTILPTIKTNEALSPFDGLSGIDYLTYHLGWLHFLSTSSTYTHDPSSTVTNYLVDYLYQGKSLDLFDGINALSEFIWNNQDALGSYIPRNFLSGTGTYTSGTQSLEKLKTLNSIIYSREFLDRDDTFVKDAFYVYEQTQEYLDNRVSNGPFWRLVKAYSYAFADQQNEVNQISVLYDLQDCPDYLLPELASLIGWELVGYDPNKWRLQLANAVDIYKKAGTKQSIIAAVNSVFTPGVVDVSGNIQELWESYIPFLIEYSLATESIHFKDFSTWTYEKSEQLQISGYDYSDFNNNIKLAVDKILLTLFEEFPDYFILAGKPFPRNSEDFVFNYRGRNLPIPPYEEIPYYLSCNISGRFLWRLADLLVCFGVPASFANKVRLYIDENTTSTVDEAYQTYSENNGWLFFTLNPKQAPNWEAIVKDPSNKKEEYLSLWNGKSSHYKLNFEAENFDFSKDTFEVDSREVILIANRLADIFSPAHAVKDSSVILNETDIYSAEEVILPHILLEKYEELPASLSSITLGNFELSAINVLGTLLEFSGGRYSFSSVVDTPLSSLTVTTAPRNAIRRRGYHNKLETGGFFTRTGFNAPLFQDSSILDLLLNTVDIPLGFIPSSLSFASVSADCSGIIKNIPEIYDRCIFTTNKNIYGYDVSATLKSRGPREVIALENSINRNYYQDRGQLDPFMAVVHKVANQKVYKKYEQHVEDNIELYAQDLFWKDVVGSLANQEIYCSGTFLSSFGSYEDFGLGKKIPKLFDLYTSAFNRHPTNYDPGRDFGPKIYAHAYGSILDNSDLEDRGSIASQYDLYTTTISNTKVLNRGSVYFSGSVANLATYGTEVVTDPTAIIASSTLFPTTVELVNSSIIHNVDMIHTSGASELNHFVVYDLQEAEAASFVFNNSFLRLKSINGLPRVRFKVSGSDFSDVYDTFRLDNFFCPEHDFRLKIRGLAALEDGSRLTDARLGVWIHTDTENTNQTWHFNKEGNWQLINPSELTIPKILSELTHEITFDSKSRGNRTFQCLDPNSLDRQTFLSSIGTFGEDEIQEYELNFNTKNYCHIQVPEEYFKHNEQVHRFDQSYVIEIFMIPGYENRDRFILIEDIDLRDDTIYDMTRIDVTGTPTGHKKYPLCNIKYVDLSKEDIRSILNYYNKLAGKSYHVGVMGRDASESSTTNFANGGSRLDYRINPEFLYNLKDDDTNHYTLLDISIGQLRESQESSLEDEISPPGDVSGIGTVPLDPNDLALLRYGFWFG